MRRELPIWRSASAVWFCLLLAGLAGAGLALPPFELLALNQHLFLAANVLALNFALGLGGQVSLAQGAFCGLGAYGTTLLAVFWPQGSIVLALLCALMVFFLAAALSLPLEKMGEGFLAMSTLALVLIFHNTVLSLDKYTGGSAGLMADFNLSLPFLGQFSSDRAKFFLFLTLIALSGYVFLALRQSRLGRALQACKDDSLAAASCGINRPLVRALAFGLGGAISSLAGSLSASSTGFISPEQYNLDLSLKALLFLVIGGPGRLVRPIIAVLALETVLHKLSFLGEAKTLTHGLLLGAALLGGYWLNQRSRS